jgi:hypothetical protein
MYADESILQSLTCISIIKFIENVMITITSDKYTDISDYEDIINNYNLLMIKYERALSKRYDNPDNDIILKKIKRKGKKDE